MLNQHIQKAREQQAARDEAARQEQIAVHEAEIAKREGRSESDPERPLTMFPDDEIERLAAAARAEQEKLVAERAKREAEAQKAQGEFRADPREKTHNAKAVAEQLLENAASAAAKHAESVRDLLTEWERRAKIRLLHERRAQIDVRAEIEATAARVVSIFERFHTDLTEQLRHLQNTLLQRHELLDETNGLERAYGSGEWESHRRLTFDRALVMIAERVSARFGRVEESGAHGTEFGRLAWWSGSGNSQLAVAEATLRIKCPTDRRLA